LRTAAARRQSRRQRQDATPRLVFGDGKRGAAVIQRRTRQRNPHLPSLIVADILDRCNARLSHAVAGQVQIILCGYFLHAAAEIHAGLE